LCHQHQAQHFGFVGPVLYSRNCRELEADGLIAKVRRMEVQTTLVRAFRRAYKHPSVSGPTRKYVESLHPEKLNALSAIVSMHAAMGELGMVFVNHHLHAKVVRELLGDGWAILAGGHAHGEDGTHTAEANAGVVGRFNRGELQGLIATCVGESALDVVNPDFRFAVAIDAHSGAASASQKLGRLSRTPRIAAEPGESQEAHRARRLALQKHAFYYEIVTLETEEMTAATNRRVQFEHDGYAHKSISYPTLLEKYQRFCDAHAPTARQLPCTTDAQQIRLLVETLSYTTKGIAASVGAEWAREHRQTHQQKKKQAEEKSQNARSSLFRDRNKAKKEKLKKQDRVVRAAAKTICKNAVDAAPLSRTAIDVLRKLRLDPALLEELQITLPEEPAAALADPPAAAAALADPQEASDDEELWTFD